MDYREFKENITAALQDFYGRDTSITISEVLKNNGIRYDGINILLADSDNKVIPNIYLNSFYEQFEGGNKTVEECASAIIDLQEKSGCPEDVMQSVKQMKEWDSVKDNVYPILLFTENNRDLLEELVTDTLLDLSIAYIVRIMAGASGIGIVKISKALFEQYGISREELHEQAISNLKKDGYKLQNLEEVVRSILIEENLSGQGPELLSDTMVESGSMYVLTNAVKQYGAAGILDKDLLRYISGGRDFFILPSSVHETIIVPADRGMNQEELNSMVVEVNASQLDADERLANHSYYYDAQAGDIRIYV